METLAAKLLSDRLAELRKEYSKIEGAQISENDKACIENLLFACGVAQDALNSNKKSDIDHANYFLSQI